MYLKDIYEEVTAMKTTGSQLQNGICGAVDCGIAFTSIIR